MLTFWDTVNATLIGGGMVVAASGKHKAGLALIVAGLLFHLIDGATTTSATGATTP